MENGTYNYAMSILKSNNGRSGRLHADIHLPMKIRAAGEGHFIHTYMCDGNPLPSFEGEPKRIAIPDDMDSLYRASVEQPERGEQSIPVCSLY